MAESNQVTLNKATIPGGEVAAADTIAAKQYQLIKLILGAAGVNSGPVSAANPMPTADADAAAALASILAKLSGDPSTAAGVSAAAAAIVAQLVANLAGTQAVTDAIEGLSTAMLTNATATGTATSAQLAGAGLKSKARYSVTLGANDSEAAAATVKIYGSDAPMATALVGEKFEIGTLTLSGIGVTNNDTAVDIDAVHVGEHYWAYIWMEVVAITGTGAKVQGRRFV
jgi:hypothetical protein